MKPLKASIYGCGYGLPYLQAVPEKKRKMQRLFIQGFRKVLLKEQLR